MALSRAMEEEERAEQDKEDKNIPPLPFPTTDLQWKGWGASTTSPPKVMALSRAMEEEERAEQDKEDKEHSSPSLPHHGPTAKRSRRLHHPFLYRSS